MFQEEQHLFYQLWTFLMILRDARNLDIQVIMGEFYHLCPEQPQTWQPHIKTLNLYDETLAALLDQPLQLEFLKPDDGAHHQFKNPQ